MVVIQSNEAEKCLRSFGDSVIRTPLIVFTLLQTYIIVSITYKR